MRLYLTPYPETLAEAFESSHALAKARPWNPALHPRGIHGFFAPVDSGGSSWEPTDLDFGAPKPKPKLEPVLQTAVDEFSKLLDKQLLVAPNGLRWRVQKAHFPKLILSGDQDTMNVNRERKGNKSGVYSMNTLFDQVKNGELATSDIDDLEPRRVNELHRLTTLFEDPDFIVHEKPETARKRGSNRAPAYVLLRKFSVGGHLVWVGLAIDEENESLRPISFHARQQLSDGFLQGYDVLWSAPGLSWGKKYPPRPENPSTEGLSKAAGDALQSPHLLASAAVAGLQPPSAPIPGEELRPGYGQTRTHLFSRTSGLREGAHSTNEHLPLLYHKNGLVKSQNGQNGQNKYEFSSTQLNLPSRLSRRIQNWARENIPERARSFEDGVNVGGDSVVGGIETMTHITVKYGLTEDNWRALQESFARVPPVSVTLGAIALFRPGRGYDVVTLRVESGALRALNKLVADVIPCCDSFPDYKPHVTLAYVKPGSCDHLVGEKPFFGIRLKFDSVCFSGRDGAMRALLLGRLR